jgi:hypothetical protein
MRRLLKRWGSLATAIIIASALTAPAFGASVSSGGGDGLKVSPVTSNIVVDPGQTRMVTVYVQNVTKASVSLQAVVNDFVAADNESGQPALLLEPDQYAPTHSLKRYIAPIGNFTLGAGQQKAIPVVISIPKGISGGGYYGAVRFAPVSSTGTSNVTLSASVGSLILVKVPGAYKEDLQLLSFDATAGNTASPQVVFFSPDDITIMARFENKGDVQEQPFGKILLKQGSSQLASYEINNTSPPGNVLPGSIRRFTVKLTKVGIFGQYTIVGNFGYGANGQLLSGQTTFYVIPLAAIIIVLLVIALIVFGIFGLPRLINRYNERVIRRASRR